LSRLPSKSTFMPRKTKIRNGEKRLDDHSG
jgi:hypothetical protein